MSALPKSLLAQVWVAEAVQLIEQNGPLDDAQALARAHRSGLSLREQLRERAWLLGERLGLAAQLARWRGAAWLMALLLAAAVVALTNGLLFAVLADGRSINAASAFVSALGLHALTLLFWLGSLLLARGGRSQTNGMLSLGRFLATLVLRLPFWRGPQAAPMLRAGTRLVARERLAPWVFGLGSHLVWTVGFVFVLLGLLLGFAFREYRLTWETTILSPQWFAAFARTTGALPALLGVPVPGLDAAAGQFAGAWPARDAAWWLLACVALYGLLPRALCALWCGWVVRRALRRIDIDLSDPYYQRLLARLQALEPALVTDAEQPGAAFVRARSAAVAHSRRRAPWWASNSQAIALAATWLGTGCGLHRPHCRQHGRASPGAGALGRLAAAHVAGGVRCGGVARPRNGPVFA
ncbi:MAG: DUF2868 domain-containing protein [Simplicispira sp.]|nr:DUF2868 domain-containing protein [Simplicispira sp.]